MNRITLRNSLRYHRRHPWQLILAIIGIALGVTVAIAVDLAATSAELGFRLSKEGLTGKTTHQIIAVSNGIDDEIYVRLRTELGIVHSSPIIELYGNYNDQYLHIIGIDPLSEASIRTQTQDINRDTLQRLILEPGALIFPYDLAVQLAIRLDDTITISINEKIHKLHVIGFYDSGSVPNESALIFCDIATAQEIGDFLGKLSWIDLVLESQEQIERVRSWLPPDYQILESEQRSQALFQMTQAFQTNLRAMSLLALLLGMFLIYNTMTFAVLQRRRLIGTLRLLGFTQTQVFVSIVFEVMAISFVATVLGLFSGIILAKSLLTLVSQTIDDLYYVSHVNQVILSPGVFIKGSILGLLAPLAASMRPASEAASTPPYSALQRSQIEDKSRGASRHLLYYGAIAILLAMAIFIFSATSLLWGFIGLFLLIIGITLTLPLVVHYCAKLLLSLIRPGQYLLIRLSLRGIQSSLSRTGVAVAALVLALAVTVGVGTMVNSFRSTVSLWLDTTLRADIYVSALNNPGSNVQAVLQDEIIELSKTTPNVASISSGRFRVLETEYGLVELFALGLNRGVRPRYSLKQGNADEVWTAFLANRAVIVSEPLAYQRGLQIDDNIMLPTDKGKRAFRIAGIFYDYDSGPGTILIHRDMYDEFFVDRTINSLGIYLKSTTMLDATLKELQQRLWKVQNVNIISNTEIKKLSLEIFDRTFTITNVLRLLAVIVAFVGILSALMALQLERTKEIAIFRASGFTRGQVSTLLGLQSGFLGLLSGLLALPTGLLLAQVLIHVINQRAFGWSMQSVFSADILLQALMLGLLSSLLAAIYPAWKMAKIPPAHALREE